MADRFAIYYAPPVSSLLWRLSSGWLGRDASQRVSDKQDTPGVDRAALDRVVVSARRYGFHATLKPPMALRAKITANDLDRHLRDFCSENAPVTIGRVELRLVDGFLALVPVPQTRELSDFAGLVVETFDSLRAPMDANERARRRSASLSDRQIWLLDCYGYPFVLEQFQFHMTLTDRLPLDLRDPVIAAARNWFAPALTAPLTLDRLMLFHERESGSFFQRLDDYELKGVVSS